MNTPTTTTTSNTKVSDLVSPCFLVDRERVESNTRRMLDTCGQLGVTLRPHTKTHKTLEIAQLSTGGTKKCIAVSTFVEAEFYADNGFDDILLAYPITQDKIERCVALMSRVSKFQVMVSDLSGVQCLQDNMDKLPAGTKWSVNLEIDTGYGRTGFLYNSVDFEKAFDTVIRHMSLVSLYCHCGGSYDITTRTEKMEFHKVTVDRINLCKDKILKAFPEAKFTVGIGSTPSCLQPSDEHRRVDEFHPGNYVFNDYEQYLLNGCREKDIACRVMTRVIAHKQELNMILVDCGFLALGHDGISQRPQDFCLFQGESNLKMVGMCQEIGKVMAKEGDLDCSKYPVGTELFIYPFHSCLTAALHPVYYVHSGENVVATMKPIRGW